MSDEFARLGGASQYQAIARALEEILIAKGVVPGDTFRKAAEATGGRTPEDGARFVARCWTDPAFEARALENANAAAREFGIETGWVPIVAVKNTPTLHNVIVCTLCSCYANTILGPKPEWFRSFAYRARIVREPRAVLAEFGLVLPPGVALRVHDVTSERRYFVIPMRPAGTEGMSEADLAKLVTRDSMIGTQLALTPR